MGTALLWNKVTTFHSNKKNNMLIHLTGTILGQKIGNKSLGHKYSEQLIINCALFTKHNRQYTSYEIGTKP